MLPTISGTDFDSRSFLPKKPNVLHLENCKGWEFLPQIILTSHSSMFYQGNYT